MGTFKNRALPLQVLVDVSIRNNPAILEKESLVSDTFIIGTSIYLRGTKDDGQ